MKKQLQHLKLLIHAVFIITALGSSAQKQFTHTATRANNSCNGDCTKLDIPGLNGNPSAILFVTPITDKGIDLNPHPIGVYYFKNQWSIFNLDQRPIPAGAMFKVEYVERPDSSYFQYMITRENLQHDGSAFIDHPAINNNPDARFRFFLSWNPEVQGGTANREEIKMQYNTEAGKWSVSNINKKPLFARVAYNFDLASGRSSAAYKAVQINELNIIPIPVSSTQPCKCPASLPPNGQATGDLTGSFPGPMVQKLLGRPMSNTVPAIGQVLKWNGVAWMPADDNATSAPLNPPVTAIQSFFKSPPDNFHGIMPGLTFPLIELTQPVILTRKSRLMISGMIELWGESCMACTKTSGGFFVIVINGINQYSLNISVVPRIVTGATISNFMTDLNPGTYNVEFKVNNPASTLTVRAKHSSIMVIPLE